MAPITPQLVKTTALAKVTQLETRVNLLVSNTTNELSPVVVYLDGAVNQLSVNGGVSAAGTWACPAGILQVQVECYGAGGGGGGGTTVFGGAGGGGGEYACEPAYAVTPGNIYTYAVGRAGQGGICAGQGGWAGGDTVFDTSSATPVTADGGLGGDSGGPNNGGTGSTNTIHFDGGAGGVSSTGIASDNPISLGAIGNVGLWWVFKGTNTSNGALSAIYDDSLRSHTGSVFNAEITGLKSAVISTTGAPAQTPGSSGNCAYFKQDLTSSTPSYVTAPVFGLGDGVAAPWNGSAITVSAWVKSDTTAGTWGYLPSFSSRQFAMILNNTDVGAGFHTGGNDAHSSGFGLYLLNGVPGFYLNPAARSTSSAKAIAHSAALPVDGTWHQIVGTFDGTTMKLYVDGALSTSLGSLGFTKFGGGSGNCISGVNAYSKVNSGFCGYMSNVWLADVAASAGYVAAAFGAVPETGGSGGGASGGSAGQGNPGASATSSTGAAAGAAVAGTGTQLGSGAGGAGGNANNTGTNAPSVSPYGGGGGGAGASSSAVAAHTASIPATQSASYCGFDSQGGNAGALYSISSEPQTGITSPYAAASLISSNAYVGGSPSSAFNGTLNSLVFFPKMVPVLAGQTVNTMTLSFTVQSTNASVLPVWAIAAGPGVTELPPSWGSDADVTAFTGGVLAPVELVTIPIPAGPAGRRINFDISGTTAGGWFGAGLSVALMFGGFQGSPTYDINDGAYNDADSFAWQTVVTGSGADDSTTDMVVNFEYYLSTGGNKIGGDGAPGALVLSYIDPRYWPVCSIQPAATTDSDGNSLAAGITTDSIMAFDPTVVTPPRVPETWHSLGSLAAGSGVTVGQARYRYSPEDGGSVLIEVNFYLPNGTVLTSGAYLFTNALPAVIQPSWTATAIQDFFAFPLMNINASTVENATLFGLLVHGKNATSPGKVALNVGASITASGNSYNTGLFKIPLT